MRIHHLNCGTMSAGVVDHCLLIETRDTLVLVDTGFGLDCVRDPGAMVGPMRFAFGAKLVEHETAIRQIQALGYDPADVGHIILTHLDLDHAGGLADFPRALVHVHSPEFLAVTARRTMNEKIRYRARQWAHGPRWMVNEDTGGAEWFGFRAVRELEGLPPEILVVPLTGHTRGHVGVAVDTGYGWLLHAGGAFNFDGEIHPEGGSVPLHMRAYQLATAVDLPQFQENQRRLRDLRRDHGNQITIINSHDKKLFRQMQQHAPIRPPSFG
ncbi:MBL fold metallo-hydrolase [Nocardia stercoris]|uniref:MBL fold metallo-hydrolase n=1 Tax=Nocardia stercoris TaxID=2483361 RepID=A0A3M2L6M0_9NOCA|nr:MBL fold metallo-hydrolase [Nocardia stercoris]RMI30178.1 MBL fold metallo-hydrolase [Nocardia stercoris]